MKDITTLKPNTELMELITPHKTYHNVYILENRRSNSWISFCYYLSPKNQALEFVKKSEIKDYEVKPDAER